jgi:hypothetical protein
MSYYDSTGEVQVIILGMTFGLLSWTAAPFPGGCTYRFSLEFFPVLLFSSENDLFVGGLLERQGRHRFK